MRAPGAEYEGLRGEKQLLGRSMEPIDNGKRFTLMADGMNSD